MSSVIRYFCPHRLPSNLSDSPSIFLRADPSSCPSCDRSETQLRIRAEQERLEGQAKRLNDELYTQRPLSKGDRAELAKVASRQLNLQVEKEIAELQRGEIEAKERKKFEQRWGKTL